MRTITAKQLRLETKRVLDQVESGCPFVVTRNGNRSREASGLRTGMDAVG